MTLREACDGIGIDEDPIGCAFVIAAMLRTSVQREPSTFEGECASINKLHELTGLRMDRPDDVRAWLNDLGTVPDIEVPDSLWLSLADASDRDRDAAGGGAGE